MVQKNKKKEKAPIVAAVGRAIARERKKARLTQEKVAQRIGVEKETVSRMETGDIPTSLERLEQLSLILGCPMKHFLWNDEGDSNVMAETIAEMIQTLPIERQSALVRIVGELVTTLQES